MKLYPHPDFYSEEEIEEFDVVETEDLLLHSKICNLKIRTQIRFEAYENEYFEGCLVGYNKDSQAGRLLYIQADDNKYFTIDIICAGDLIEVI